jgi:hypothetical protein
VASVIVIGLSHLECPWSTWSSSSSVRLLDLHVISLILLLRIRLTRRCRVCWSEPRGVPRPAYNEEGCASLSQRASQDWHKALESMPDKEYVPEEVNLGPGGAKSARRQIIRPGPGESRPGPAGVHYPGPAGTQLRAVWRRIPAKPDPPDPAQPGAGRWRPGRRRAQPGRGRAGRPSRGRTRREAQPGGGSAGLGDWRGSGKGEAAQPGRWKPAQPGHAARRPSRGCALCRPSCALCRPRLNYAGPQGG